MLNKKLMILAIFFVSLLAVSAVSAEDNATDDVVSVEETNEIVTISDNDVNNTVISYENNNVLAVENQDNDDVVATDENELSASTGSFTDLANDIENAGDELNLEGNYEYLDNDSSTYQYGISINKKIIINGNGFTINGNGNARVFQILSEGVLLNNISFVNCKAPEYHGGAIMWDGANGKLINCSFVNCSMDWGSGAFCWKGINGFVKDCSFENCDATMGGATYWIGDNGTISNCSFVNCQQAVDWYGECCNLFDCSFVNCQQAVNWYGKNGNLYNCSFEDCSHHLTGGAVYWSGQNGKLYECNFVNCYVLGTEGGSGGAISWMGIQGVVLDCSFLNCYVIYDKSSAGSSGAIYMKGNDGIISRCSLVNCNVSSSKPSRVYDSGGAIRCEGKNIEISDCIFENCVASIWGGAVYLTGDDSNIFNCNFTNCRISLTSSEAHGGAVYLVGDDDKLFNCNFVDCHVPYTPTSPFAAAVYWNGYGGELYNCSFLNCYAISSLNNYGGAVGWYGSNGKLSDSKFVNCHVTSTNFKGAIHWYGGNGVISNTYFDPYYNSIYKEIDDLVIYKLYSQIDCNNVSFTYMGNNDFKLYLKDYFGNNLENRQIIFENKDLNLIISSKTDNNGLATLPVEFTKNAGNYNVSVSFNGDDNYNSIQKEFNLNIEPLDSSVITNNCSSSVNLDTTLTANVVCSNGVTIKEGAVTFFDGETRIGEANVINGVATLTYAPTTAGKHTIKAIYSSNNYNSSNNTFILTVSKSNVDLNIDALTVYFSNPSNFVINVNSNSKGVNEGKIKLYIDNVFIDTIDVENGVAGLSHVMNATGSFNLSVVYDETDNYFAKNDSKIFYVDKMPTTLSGETTFFDEEQSRIFAVNLRDNEGNGVNNQTVKIEVVKYSGESKTFVNVTDVNGIAVFDVGNLAGGMWIVRGIFDENNNYKGSLFTDKFIVIRMNTTTTVDEIKDSHKGYPIQLHANILDEFGVWITDGIAHFYVDGKDCGYIDYSTNRVFPYRAENKQVLRASVSDFDDELGATVVDPSKLYLEYIPAEGTHTINVVYEGTSLYRASNHTTTFEVQDGAVPTTLTATSISTVYNGGKYLVATLKDAWDKPINGVKVSIKLNGVKYLTTDKNGQVKLSTNGLAPKVYTAVIAFAGNSKYVKSTKSVKVTVTKAAPKLTAKAKTFKKSVKIKKYTVTLKTNQNKVMKNTKVTIKVNKKTYTAKTNKKGVATFKITKLTKKGKYTATVTYKGSSYYNKVTKKVKIVVK